MDNKELYERLTEKAGTNALTTSGQRNPVRQLAHKLINSSYDDMPVEHILTDICTQAGFKAICPKSDRRLYQVRLIMQAANQSLDNVCRMVGWYWRYSNTEPDTIVFADIAATIREHIAAAEKALQAVCDDIDVVGALDDPVRRDGWYSTRYAVESALGRLVTVKDSSTGNDLIGRLFRDWTGKVPQ